MPLAPDQNLINKIALEWYSVSQGNSPKTGLDPFFRFVSVWIAFNALYASHAREGLVGDRKQMEDFCNDPMLKMRHDHLLENDIIYRQSITTILSKPVRSMRTRVREPGFSGDRRPIHVRPRSDHDIETRSKDIMEVLGVVYRIRNNLFHGGKQPYNPRDCRLVESAAEIVTRLIASMMDEMTSLA
jgi:hypothetical protein